MLLRPLQSTLFPYTTLFRSRALVRHAHLVEPNREPVAIGWLARFSDGHHDAAPIGIFARNRRLHKRRIGDREGNFFCRDRKSTRLNSSHLGISYAVFCLKKK